MAVLTSLTVAAPETALAGPADNFTLTKTDNVEGEALIGENVTYTLTASGTQSSGTLYNLGFRDVLPVGFSFVSAAPAPALVLTDTPSPGQTTLVWENISDLPPNSVSSVSYTINTDPDVVPGTNPVGSTATNNADAAASLDPFAVPDVDPLTGEFTLDVDGRASASHTIDILAFRVEKRGPDELLRGVHENGLQGAAGGTAGGTYTVTITNNPHYATSGVTLSDVLGPEFEFLGCSNYYASDNTTNVPIREDGAAINEEYVGAGPIYTRPATADCVAPTSVATVGTGSGNLANTEVTWAAVDLAPNEVFTVEYQAGVPMRMNTTDFTTPPVGALGNGRNLDNNSGPATSEPSRVTDTDPELLDAPEQIAVNTAEASGTYLGTVRTHDDTVGTEIEDLIIVKSHTGALLQSGGVPTTLTITTSEYRDYTNLVVRDLLPGALCFANTYVTDLTPGSDWDTSDCPGASAGGSQITVSGTSSGTSTQPVHSVRDITGGGDYGFDRFEVVWSYESNPLLADVDRDSSVVIGYTANVRLHHRVGQAAAMDQPVLAGDEVTNEVEVSGPGFVAAGLGNTGGFDPEPDGGIDGDTSWARLTNSFPTIDKEIAGRSGPLAAGAGATASTCADATVTWHLSGSTTSPAEYGYGPGDLVCFRLTVDFPNSLDYEGTQVQDLLPPAFRYLPGSATRTAADTIVGTTVAESDHVVTFSVGAGGGVTNGGEKFQWVIAAEIIRIEPEIASDITANLMKLVHNNNGGLVYQYRDSTPVEWTGPQVFLGKGVKTIDSTDNSIDFTAASPDHDDSLNGNNTPVIVQANSDVTYRIDLWNTGNADALQTEVWDTLPTPFTCADVTVTPAFTCTDNAGGGATLKWTGLTVPGSIDTGAGDTTPDTVATAPLELNYTVSVPSGLDPASNLMNTAGVRRYQAATNAAISSFEYVPANNVDPALTPNTDEASDTARIITLAPTATKTQTTDIDEAGNDAATQATIGEIVRYDLTFAVPEGTTVYDGFVIDTLPSGMVYFVDGTHPAAVATSVAADQFGTTLNSGTLTTPAVGGAGDIRYDLPALYRNEVGDNDDELTITFYTQVADVAINDSVPQSNLNNDFSFAWHTEADAGSTAVPKTVGSNGTTVEVVEPNPNVVKDHTIPAGNDVSPGDTVTYRIAVTNANPANVSVLHDVELVDTLPIGITPLDNTSSPVTATGDLVASSGITPAGAFTGTWDQAARTITWTPTDQAALTSIDPDASVAFTYQALVNSPAIAGIAITNTVSLTANSLAASDPNQTDGRGYNDNDSDTVNPAQPSLTKDIAPLPDDANDQATIRVGEAIDFQAEVTLPTGTAVYDGTLFDTLPAGFVFDSFGTPVVSGVCELLDGSGNTTGVSLTAADIETMTDVGIAGRQAWFLGDITAIGSPCTVTVPYTAHVDDVAAAVDGAVLTNRAQFSFNKTDLIATDSPATTPTGFDSPQSANWDGTTAVETESIEVVEPQLAIDKDVATLSGLTVNPACDNTAGNNSTGSNDSDDEGSTTNGCDVAAGAHLRYTVTVTGTGRTDAHDVIVTDLVPVGLTVDVTSITDGGTYDAGTRTITWNVAGPVANATPVTFNYNAFLAASSSLNQGQDLSNSADIASYWAVSAADRAAITNGDVPEYGNGASATRGSLLPDVVTVEAHFPRLTIAKTHVAPSDPTDARFDQPFNWSITVTNTDSAASAFNVDVADTLPAGWAYVASSATVTTPFGTSSVEPAVAGQTLTWDNSVSGPAQPLGPGQSIVVTIQATPNSAVLAPDSTTGISNTGSANPHINQVATAGEDASGATTCCGGTDYAATGSDSVVIRRVDLAVDKRVVEAGPYYYGDTITYEIDVINQGPDAATGVTLSDLLDVDLTYVSTVSSDVGAYNPATGVWDLTPNPGDAVPPGTHTLTLRVKVDVVGSITNTAEIITADQWDPDSNPGAGPSSEDDTDSVTINARPSNLGNRIWLDLDRDGVQDPDEIGIAGVDVTVSWVDASGIAQTATDTTDANGNYAVAGLPVDTDLTITVDSATLPSGLSQSFELIDNPNLAATQAANGLTGGTDNQVTGLRLTDAVSSYLDVDFGYAGINSIGDEIWYDVDGNGTNSPEAGDVPLVGVDVDLTWAGFDGVFGSADDMVFPTDTTDASGNYLFENLPDGDYRVTVDGATLPYAITAPTYDLNGVGTANSSGDITLGAGAAAENKLDVDFAYTAGPGSLGDQVWLDSDADGTMDPGEVGISGVTVNVTWTNPDGADVTFTTTTAADGTWSIPNLPLGDFTVTVDTATLPANVTPTFDADGTGTPHTSAVTLTSANPTSSAQDFGYRGTGSIGDTIFYDSDNNASSVIDGADHPLSGVDVTIEWTSNGTTYTETTTTDATGSYIFTNLPAGDYTVTVDEATLPPGLSANYDDDGTGTPSATSITLTDAAPSDLDQDFSYTGAGTIGDTVWFDTNADGVLDAGEVGLAGVTVNLTWPGEDGVFGGGDDVVFTTTTDASGNYLFENLPDGPFQVTVDDTALPGGLSPTYDADGTGTAHTSVVTLVGGASDLNQDFGYRGSGTLGATVFYDLNGNGSSTADPASGGNPAEPAIPGVEITVTWTNPGGTDLVFVTTTDSNGEWSVPNLPHGDYTVAITGGLPTGSTASYDLDGGADSSVTTTLDTATPSRDTVDFSVTGTSSLGDLVWFDQDSSGTDAPNGQDQVLEDVTLTITGTGLDGIAGNADDLTWTVVTDAAGLWSVPNLLAGDYTVTVDTATLPLGIDIITYQDEFGVSGNPADLTSTSTHTLGANENYLYLDFSFEGRAGVGDTLWLDMNGDGVQDADEVGLANVDVTATYQGPGGPITVTVSTDADGKYFIPDLPFDTPITVTVNTADPDFPTGLVPTFDGDEYTGSPTTGTPNSATVTITSAVPIDLGMDFGYRGEGAIGDQVWLDIDGSGEATMQATPQTGDLGLPNVGVTLTWTNSSGGTDMVLHTTTDASGVYRFDNLPEGNYVVTVDGAALPTGTTALYDSDLGADLTSAVTLSPGNRENLDQDFSVTGTGTIGDHVWHDRNGDGVIDPGEESIGGVTLAVVWVDPVTGATYTWTVTTDASGDWSIPNAPAGGYTVTVDRSTLPTSYAPVFDRDGTPDHVTVLTLGSGQTIDDIDFGYQETADVSITKSHDGDFSLGRENTWNLRVVNHGPGMANAPVVVTDVLPTRVHFVRTMTTDWNCVNSAQTVTCTYQGTTGAPTGMASGVDSTVELVVTLDTALAGEPDQTFVNTATVSHETVDPSPDNNTSSDPTRVPLSMLTIDKTLKGSITDGGRAKYVLTITNEGPSTTRGIVTVTDVLPAGLTYQSAKTPSTMSCRTSSKTVTCTGTPNLAVGSSLEIELTVKVSATAGVAIINEATVSGGNVVNQDPLAPETVSSIRDQVEGDSGLAVVLGMSQGQELPDTDAARAMVKANALAFTGSAIGLVVGLALFLLLAGAALFMVGRRKETS